MTTHDRWFRSSLSQLLPFHDLKCSVALVSFGKEKCKKQIFLLCSSTVITSVSLDRGLWRNGLGRALVRTWKGGCGVCGTWYVDKLCLPHVEGFNRENPFPLLAARARAACLLLDSGMLKNFFFKKKPPHIMMFILSTSGLRNNKLYIYILY